MLALKYLLITGGLGMIFAAICILTYDLYRRLQVQAASNWTLGYDANDSIAGALAERVALNARDAGIAIEQTTAGTADMRLMRIPLASPDLQISLVTIARTIGIAMPEADTESAENTYGAEHAILTGQRAIPLFHLPQERALSPALRGWNTSADGR